MTRRTTRRCRTCEPLWPKTAPNSNGIIPEPPARSTCWKTACSRSFENSSTESPSTLAMPVRSARCCRPPLGASTPSAHSAPAWISTTLSQAFARRSLCTWLPPRHRHGAAQRAAPLIADLPAPTPMSKSTVTAPSPAPNPHAAPAINSEPLHTVECGTSAAWAVAQAIWQKRDGAARRRLSADGLAVLPEVAAPVALGAQFGVGEGEDARLVGSALGCPFEEHAR